MAVPVLSDAPQVVSIYFILEVDQYSTLLEFFLLLKNVPLHNYKLKSIKKCKIFIEKERMKVSERGFFGNSAIAYLSKFCGFFRFCMEKFNGVLPTLDATN